MIHCRCDYCGGYDIDKPGESGEYVGMLLEESWTQEGESQNVETCSRCFIKVLDTVLGPRKKAGRRKGQNKKGGRW